jgi:hypothetical protein
LKFCLALAKTGGRLTIFELDPGRASNGRSFANPRDKNFRFDSEPRSW